MPSPHANDQHRRKRQEASFWRNILRMLVTRPRNFQTAIGLMALFLHCSQHTEFVLDGLERQARR